VIERDLSAQSDNLVVEIFDGAVGGRRVQGATVHIEGEDDRSSDGNGFVHFYMRGGRRTITGTIDGCEPNQTTIELNGEMDQVYPAIGNSSLRMAYCSHEKPSFKTHRTSSCFKLLCCR
jgi:hypothetical protein